MSCSKHKLLHRKWTKPNYFISTDPALVPVSELNEVFASEVVYWADPLPDDVMRETLDNSLCFGLYQLAGTDNSENSSSSTTRPKIVGFARYITDFTTFVFLTDVYINPSCQGEGLGSWLVECVQETIESMPFLRRSMLFTNDWKRSVPFYEKLMGMSVIECKKRADGQSGEGPAVMQRLGPAFPASLR